VIRCRKLGRDPVKGQTTTTTLIATLCEVAEGQSYRELLRVTSAEILEPGERWVRSIWRNGATWFEIDRG
jgi:hypothetical protein